MLTGISRGVSADKMVMFAVTADARVYSWGCGTLASGHGHAQDV